MPALEIHVGAEQFLRLERVFAQAGKQAPLAIRRTLKHTGDKTTTAVRRALPGQTGLKPRVIQRAVKGSMSGTAYVIRSRGGDISLKYFGARETRAGVSAAPWNHRHIYAGTFMKGGRFPDRVALRLNGQVFMRAGASRLPIVKQKSGLFIPEEMVRGASEAAFTGTVATELPTRLEHELMRILGG